MMLLHAHELQRVRVHLLLRNLRVDHVGRLLVRVVERVGRAVHEPDREDEAEGDAHRARGTVLYYMISY